MATDVQQPVEIHLRAAQLVALQQLAAQWDESLDEVISRSVDALLAENADHLAIEEHPLWAVVGLGRSGLSDVAENHDKYLAQIVYEESHPCPDPSS